MKTTNKVLFTLLMAIVMMTLSPAKVWAWSDSNFGIDLNGNSIAVDGSVQLHLNQGDKLRVYVVYIENSWKDGDHDLYAASDEYTLCDEIDFASNGRNSSSPFDEVDRDPYARNSSITIQETGDYIIELYDTHVYSYVNRWEQFDMEGGSTWIEENYFDYATAKVKIHKVTHNDAVPSPNCQTAGTIEHWSCDGCHSNWDNRGASVNNLDFYSEHNYVNGECSVCHAEQPYSDIITGIIPEISSNSRYPWVVSTDDGRMPGFMSSNVGHDFTFSESTLTFETSKETYLSFDYAVSCDDDWGGLTITVDGNTVVNVTGVRNDHYSETLQAGSHTVALSYEYTFKSSSRADRGYIYNLVICDHSGNTNEIVDVPATCDMGSHKEFDCSVCGSHYVYDVQNDRLGHNYVNGACSNCHDESSEIAASTFVDATLYARTTNAEVGELTYTRTISESQVNQWQALFVPFDIEVTDELLEKCDIAKPYMVATDGSIGGNVNEGEGADIVVLKKLKAGDVANHGTAYYIRPKEAGAFQLELSDVTLYATDATTTLSCATTEDTYEFVGQYAAGKPASGTWYALSGGGFRLGDNESPNLPAMRWYMTKTSKNGSPAPAPARLRIMTWGEDDTTGIMETQTARPSDNAIYSLSGVRMNKLQKGINIINGKKIVR